MKTKQRETLHFMVGVLVVISTVACSQKSTHFDQIENSSSQESIVSTDETDIVSNPPPIVQPPIDDIPSVLKIEGFATGVASITTENMWEKFAPRGTTIQIHYNLIGTARHVGFQIVKFGATVKLGEVVQSSDFAEGEDGSPYSFAQYLNLETQPGGYTFNLPLKYKISASSPEQYLKIGKYTVFLTACANLTLASCVLSKPFEFEVK